jgi:tetratricopeptide (TPR) repeat protein
MEDIRFDVMPVLQDLASQQASRMIGEARKLANEGFWEGAQTTIKRVLEMDPANREAVAFRKTIADALRRRETGPRISTLTAAAEQHVADKQFTKAIEAIDTALKIEPSSEELRKRASEVRELMEREKHAVDLLQAARQDLATEHFTGAYENATQALKYDPNRSEALQLIASVQLEIEKRDRQKRYREGLDKAREVLRSGAHGEAIRLLQELLGTFPGSLEASQLLREATVARDVHQRQKNLHDALASVQELLRAQRFPEAVQRLEALTTEFAGEDEVIQMLRYAREEWKVLQRTEALERAKTNVIQLQNEGRFDEALHLVQRSQTEFPGEAALARLEQAVTAAKAEAERRAALERVIADAETKKRAGELTAALKAVDLGLEQHGPDQRLLGVREQIEQDWRLAQRNQAYQKTLGEGRDFIARAEWDKAIAHFQQMVRQYPEEAEPKKLLASAETSLAETRKTKERELKLFEARQKAEEEQKRRAQEAEEKAREQRRQLTAKVEDTLARAYLAVSQNDLAKAAKLIAEAGTIDANHPGLPGAQRDLEAAQRLAMRPSAGKKSSPAKGIAIGAGIGVLVLGGAFFFLPKPSDNTVKPPKPIGGETIPPQPPPAKPEPVKPVAVNPEPAKPDPAKPVAIGLTPQALDIQHQVGGPNPPDRSIFIDGKGPYQASVRNGQWVTISPANGTMPGPLAVSIHPAQLPPGSYATQLVVVSGDTKKFANIHLTVTEAAKPVVVTPPPTPVTPTDEPKKPVTGGIFLGGRRLGDLVWSGTLAPGAKVVIGPGGVINGGGSVVRAPIPRDVAFDAVSQTPGVQAIAGPNSLTLTNTSGAPVQDVTVHWTVK